MLNILKEPLTIEGTLSATLDDDRRLAIYDHLESTAQDKDKLKELVLSSIPKRQNISFKSKNEIKANLRGMRKFRNNVLDKLSFEKSQGNNLASRLVPSSVRKAGKETALAIQGTLDNIGLYSPLSHLWHLRFILYLGLSYIAYHYLVMTLLPIAPLFLSVATTAMLSSVLFYTVALAPVWWLSWICLKSLKEGVREYLLHWKKSEVCDSLLALTQSQEFIANHLSQKIVDLPHFDIGKLTGEVCHHQHLLEESLKKLQRYSFGEKRLCRGYTQLAVDETIEKIKSQQKYIESQLQDLACHIALRIGQEIDLLERTSSKLKFEPLLPPKQVQKLKTFIWSYGDETALHQFKKNVNPINKWVNKTNRFFTPQDEAEASSLNQPWGGNSIRKDALNGWNIILNAFVLDPTQKEAALQLNGVLAGKIYPTPRQFHEMIRKLETGEQVSRVLQNIQVYIFATLNSKSLQNARLLSSHHKNLIAQWYHQNEENIKKAERDISIFFDKIKRNSHDVEKFDDDYLNNIFELLEGSEIYHHSKGIINTSNKRYQTIRKYFEEYSGETSRVIRFLRFVPSPDADKLLMDVAKKRLGWILRQIRRDDKHTKRLTESDIELFQDCTLISSKDKFDFSEFISHSMQFNQPWDPKMERFLRECQRNGLDSGKLLKNYQMNNQRIKPFLLSKIDNPIRDGAKKISNSSEVIGRRTHRVKH
ncbi:MAG: hypothetical protein J0H47_16350 [Gammaproteobacteria bacterium]|nr:hypothetical protein [Gammaproteobacteria bacterium]